MTCSPREYLIYLLRLKSQCQISCLYPVYFHVWRRPESNLSVSDFMCFFFPVHTFMFQIWSVPQERKKKIRIGSLELCSRNPASVIRKNWHKYTYYYSRFDWAALFSPRLRPNWRGSGFSYIWFDQSREVAAAGSVWQVQKPKQPLNASLLKPPTWFHYRPTL